MIQCTITTMNMLFAIDPTRKQYFKISYYLCWKLRVNFNEVKIISVYVVTFLSLFVRN